MDEDTRRLSPPGDPRLPSAGSPVRPGPRDRSDDELIAAFYSERDAELAGMCFDVLIGRYRDELERMVRKRASRQPLPEGWDAEDIVQEVALKVFLTRDNPRRHYRPIKYGSFRAWLHCITSRRDCDVKRRKRLPIVVLAPEPDDQGNSEEAMYARAAAVDGFPGDPMAQALLRETEARLRREVQGLKEPQRACIEACVLGDQSIGEFARERNIPSNNAYAIKRRSLIILRDNVNVRRALLPDDESGADAAGKGKRPPGAAREVPAPSHSPRSGRSEL